VDSTQTKVYLRGSYIPLDCQFIVAAPTGSGSVVFTEVYHIRRNHRLQTIKLGEWHPASGPGWTNLSFYARRRDLQGVTINAAVISDVSKFKQCLKTRPLTAHTLLYQPPINNTMYIAYCPVVLKSSSKFSYRFAVVIYSYVYIYIYIYIYK